MTSSSLFRGVLCMLGFALIVALMAPVIQHILTFYSVIVLFFLVSCIRVLVLLFPLLRGKYNIGEIDKRYFGLHGLYAVFYTAQLMLYFSSLAYVPIFEAILLFQCWPLLVPIFDHLLLGRKSRAVVYGGILTGFAGVALVVWDPSAVFAWNIGILLGLGAAATNALASLVNRLLTQKGESVNSVVAWNMVLCFALSTLLLFLTGDYAQLGVISWDLSHFWSFGFILVGLFSYYLAKLMTQAYHYASPTQVAPVAYSSLIFGGLIQWCAFGVPPSCYAILGGCLVVIGAVIVLRKGAMNG